MYCKNLEKTYLSQSPPLFNNTKKPITITEKKTMETITEILEKETIFPPKKLGVATSLNTATISMDFNITNSLINTLLFNFENYQNDYKKTNPTYYRQTKISDILPNTAKLPFEVRVSDYSGPKGTGWQIEFFVTDSGHEYWRSVGYGPEALSRTRDWVFIK